MHITCHAIISFNYVMVRQLASTSSNTPHQPFASSNRSSVLLQGLTVLNTTLVPWYSPIPTGISLIPTTCCTRSTSAAPLTIIFALKILESVHFHRLKIQYLKEMIVLVYNINFSIQFTRLSKTSSGQNLGFATMEPYFSPNGNLVVNYPLNPTPFGNCTNGTFARITFSCAPSSLVCFMLSYRFGF
jgi:hypothetical protein